MTYPHNLTEYALKHRREFDEQEAAAQEKKNKDARRPIDYGSRYINSSVTLCRKMRATTLNRIAMWKRNAETSPDAAAKLVDKEHGILAELDGIESRLTDIARGM